MSEFDKALKNVKCYMFWDAVDGQWLDFLHVPFGRLTFDWLMDQLNDAHLHDIAQYDAENAKLRELLADTLMQPRDYCKKYGIEYESWDSANAHLDARMRELGVEVE